MGRASSWVARGWLHWALLPSVLAVLLAGCASLAAHETPPIPLDPLQVFHYLYPVGAIDIATMDPQQVLDIGSRGVVQLVFDGLVTLDQHLNVEMWGAKSVDISQDALTYTFHLRAGQAFSNGTPVTSADYAYAINRAINPCVASPVSYYMTGTANELIRDSVTFANEGCRNGYPYQLPTGGQATPLITTLLGDSLLTPDDQTLVIKLSHPTAYFLQALAYPVADAVDPSVVGQVLSNETWTDKLYQGATGQGGSGMYYVARWDHHGGGIVLKPNPHWWGLKQGMKPYLKEIDFTIFKSSDTSYAAYQAGHGDIGVLTPNLIPQAQHQPGYHQLPELTTLSLAMNWAFVPINNLDVRQALCLAIDRDALNQHVYGGTKLPTWHLVPQGMPGYNASLTGPDGVSSTQGDPDRARAHWQAYLRSLHGAPAPPIFYEDYQLNSSISHHKLGLALAQQWQAVLGIHVAIDAPGEGFMGASLPLPLSPFEWPADYPDPQDFLSLLLTPGSPYNTGVNVPAATALDQQADSTLDPARRYTLYNQAEQLYVSQAAWCPLFQDETHYVLRPWVHEWSETGLGMPSLDAWIATFIAAH